MKDYRVSVKVRNNYMLKAMEAVGIYTAAQLSRASGVQQSTIGVFLNLKQTPYNRDGSMKKAILDISKVLKILPEDLFPPQHLVVPLETNRGSVEADYAEIRQITETQSTPYDRMVLLENCRIVGDAVSTLTNREQDVLSRRFGLHGMDKHTFEQIADEYGVSRQRVRQIEQRAFSKLRRSRSIHDAAESYIGV